MENNTKEPSLPLPAWLLWVFRLSLFSIPVGLLGSAIFCVVYHVPNPRSVIPKAVICVLLALSFAIYIFLTDRQVQSNSTKPKEKRFVLIAAPIMVVLIWIGAYFLPNKTGFFFTGDGDPVFSILWFVMACINWFLLRDKDLPSKEVQAL